MITAIPRSLKVRVSNTILMALVAYSLAAVPSVHAQTLKVYAASSMTNVLNELVANYSANHSNEVVAVFGSSSSLARQISQGAPADLYISANERWVDYLVERGEIGTTDIVPLISNRLVVVAPKNAINTDFTLSSAKQWRETLQTDRLAIGEPNSVPAGIYAKQALTSLGVWQELRQQLAPTNNVRTALAFVEREEVPLGIVYASDTTNNTEIELVANISEKYHDEIIYPMAVLNRNKDTLAFAEYLTNPDALKIFIQFGFTPLSKLND